MSQKKVSLKEAKQFGGEKIGAYLVWASEDDQGGMWMGYGETEGAAIEDARREVEALGAQPESGLTAAQYAASMDYAAHVIVCDGCGSAPCQCEAA